MPKKEKMPTNAQAAAVRTMVTEGKNLTDIKKQFPELAEGVAMVTKEQERPKSRGSGPLRHAPLERPTL